MWRIFAYPLFSIATLIFTMLCLVQFLFQNFKTIMMGLLVLALPLSVLAMYVLVYSQIKLQP